MAVDTASKRFSMLNFGTVPTVPLFPASGSIGGGDRLHMLNLYSGFGFSPPAISPVQYYSDILLSTIDHSQIAFATEDHSDMAVTTEDHSEVRT